MQFNATYKGLAVAIGCLILLAVFFFMRPSGPQAGVSDAERKRALTPPVPEQAADYESFVRNLAEESATLAIGPNCAMEPLVLKMKEGAVLTITNTDTVPHRVEFENGGVFYIAPQFPLSLDMTTTFGKNAGVHRYRCDDISTTENVGAVYIVP